MGKTYLDNDANLDLLKDKVIGIVGYGNQGYAQALNLRDSGLNVIVAELEGTENYKKAISQGFKPMSASELTKKADYIQILLPDESQGKIYKNEIEPYLTSGKIIGFSHGFNIHFGEIVPPKDVDVVMISPKGPGRMLRRTYEEGICIPSLIAVAQDYSGKAFDYALAYGKAIGSTRCGIFDTTFKEETETDLFGEQVVLCGGISHLITAAYETLVEAGYQPRNAYFECCYEVKLIGDLIYENGIADMRKAISDTAEWGDLLNGPRIVTDETKKAMKEILNEIQDGSFAKKWIAENEAGRPDFNRLENIGRNHPIENVGKELRDMMPWLKKD